MRPRAAWYWLAFVAACGGSRGDGAPVAKRDDAAIAHEAPAVADVAARPLGMPEIASFGWRKRGGHPAFRVARKAEDKDGWAEVVTTTKQALAADPAHLEAAWLLAVGLAKTGKLDDVLPPLQLAVAGDFGKWGAPSVEHPALQAFLATPTGKAWAKRVDQDRATYAAAIGRAIVVVAAGDLYGFDPDSGRWYRLTRTFGAVVAALQSPGAPIAYVTRVKGNAAVGLVDLASATTWRPVDVGAPVATIVVSAKGAWVNAKGAWRELADGKLSAPLAKLARPAGASLEVTAKTARVRAAPVADVIADWNEAGLASAIRIGKSNRVVAVPGQANGKIDGNTAAWSPDRAQLAFAAQLDEHCDAKGINAAAFVADAATGTVRELERATTGLAVAWVADRRLAIAGDHGVHVIDLASGATTELEGAEDLAVPRHRPRCTPAEEPTEPPPEEPETEAAQPAQPDAAPR